VGIQKLTNSARVAAVGVAILAVTASQACAGAFTFDFSSTYQTASSSGNPYGNSLTFRSVESSAETVSARAYYTQSSDSGAFGSAYLGLYSGGLGISNPTEGGPPATAPNHAIDNNGRDDYLLLEFDSPNHVLTEFEIGWVYQEAQDQNRAAADVQIWVGGPSVTNFDLAAANALCGNQVCNPDQLTNLGFVQVPANGVFENVALGTTQQVSTQISGRYVLIAGQRGETDDYFKLDAAQVNEVITAPEPSSLSLLFGAAGALAMVARRRRRAKT
jgi:hypothetical protein